MRWFLIIFQDINKSMILKMYNSKQTICLAPLLYVISTITNKYSNNGHQMLRLRKFFFRDPTLPSGWTLPLDPPPS